MICFSLHIPSPPPPSGDIKGSFNWLEYQQRFEGRRLPQRNIVVRAYVTPGILLSEKCGNWGLGHWARGGGAGVWVPLCLLRALGYWLSSNARIGRTGSPRMVSTKRGLV